MNTGRLEVICGKDSSGKTAMALGKALQALTEQKTVIVIQFLKGSEKIGNLEVLKRMEPELKVFRFEKADRYFAELSDSEKKDEQVNIRNGLNYAKKVLTTQECDLLVLDEALGLVDQNIVTSEELEGILQCRDQVQVIVTGKILPEGIRKIADKIEMCEQQLDN